MRLPYVDPHKERGPLYRANLWFAGTSLGQGYARHIGPRIDPWLYRVTRGRYPRVIGTVLTAPLTTTGAVSGQPRVVPLAYFHDGQHPVLIASNYGGPKHPNWYYNLTAHPDCDLGGERFVAAEVTDPDEYARLFALAMLVYPGYRDYQIATAAVGRTIPIFRLTPA